MQKGSALPLLLLGALIIIVGYFYVSTNQKNNLVISPVKEIASNKNTYTSTNLGFKFDYSTELNVKEDSEEEFNQRGNGDFRKNFKGYVFYEPGKFVGAVIVLGKDKSYETNPFTLWIFDNPEELSIDAWYKNYWYYPFVWGDFTYTGKFELAPKMEATISGQMGKSGIIDYQPGKPKFIYVSNSGRMYLFRIIGEDGDKILSAFKFTDQSIEEQFCGGIAGVECPSGYSCQLDGKYPDAGGKCIKN